MHKTATLQETQKIAKDFAGTLVLQEKATIVALYGDLGSGKTTFVQHIAKALGVEITVTSPTFVIERVYKLTGQKFDHLIHIDCYRIEESPEITLLGWNEKVTNPRNLIFVEWANRIEEILPKDTIKIYFESVDEKTRNIRVMKHGI